MVSKYTSGWRKQAYLAVGLFLAAPLVLSMDISPAKADGIHSDDTEFYVGLDSLQVLASGTYTGLNNPNYNRLTFLFAHREENAASSHFHGIGAYSYLGTVDNPSVNSTNANNRIPETYTGILPLQLLPGTGIYAGRLVSADTHEEYSNLNVASITSLADATEAVDQYLFNSSGGRWRSPLTGATIGLQLVEISSGLNIANESGENILQSIGDIYTLGGGDDFSFTPTFWTQKTATPGKYSATFKLVDLSNNYQESGTFSFDFRVEKVPEPSTTIALGLAGLLALSVSHLKKRTVDSSEF
ncbi:all3515 family Zur-repressed PEP-CTERM protein [Nostoc sp. CMAA1605]|uniref:all3515 family Zur-repressed PEP-CTERM protein n=1 Tax=Nostoc sp. CMAA1605 TaxID=2055159 RepID=UPI001F4642C9|nr:all3515 family Zur-repressed PEP-CTERM protein [Nostoc sp. CMAA1605]MCF4966002.1 PEP-CTERM sorting domain-containing protein [Nostoc sp. CMAA1605]